MRPTVSQLLLTCTLVRAGGTSAPVHQVDARTIVDRAIRETGGKALLSRYGARTWSEKAVYHGTGVGSDERYEATYSGARGTAFTLLSLGELTVKGRVTGGIRARHDGRNDIDLFFDRATGLLAMSATHYREARTGRDIHQQTTVGNYKVVAGIQTPMTVAVTSQGTRVVDSSVEVTYRRRLDTRVFARP